MKEADLNNIEPLTEESFRKFIENLPNPEPVDPFDFLPGSIREQLEEELKKVYKDESK